MLAASDFYNDLQVENWRKHFLQKPRNSHDDWVYVLADQVDPARVYVERSGFPKKFIVSGGVSNLGKTSLHFIEEDVKMNMYYYINEVLAKMLPETHALSDGDKMGQSVTLHIQRSPTFENTRLTSLSQQTGPQTPAT